MVQTVKNTLTIIALVATLIAVGAVLFSVQRDALGSVDQGSEYTATTVTHLDRGTSTVKSIGGTVGSVVITSTSVTSVAGPYIAFYDTAPTSTATSSMTAVLEIGMKASTTPPAGTYTYDVAFGKGIYMWVDPAFSGHYTVTYR